MKVVPNNGLTRLENLSSKEKLNHYLLWVESEDKIKYKTTLGYSFDSKVYLIKSEGTERVQDISVGDRILFVPDEEYYIELYKFLESLEGSHTLNDPMALRYYRVAKVLRIENKFN